MPDRTPPSAAWARRTPLCACWRAIPAVRMTARDLDVVLEGPVTDTRLAASLLEELLAMALRGTQITSAP
ncbi:hypothetical protein QJS66_03610 [Kocuria rhizophila]|nr:hypothetical protein QJS66_03610 [Kocuria rhizophila]